MIKISVIVPIYNAERYIEDCVSSIINQTYPSIEVILIDDGSTDESLNICKRFACLDNRVCVFHKENEGLVETRKFGINMANGDYIMFVDADDYIDLTQVEALVAKIDLRPSDMLLFNLTEEYEDRKIIKKNHFAEGIYDYSTIKEIIVPKMISYDEFFDFGVLPNAVCKLINRKFYLDNMPIVDSNITLGEDAAITYQLLIKAKTIEIVDIASYHYNKRYETMMWSKIAPQSIDCLIEILKTAFEKEGVSDITKKQLKDFKTFLFMLKEPYRIPEVDDLFKNENMKVALYGAGGFGQAVKTVYSDRISIWSDKQYVKYQQLGYDVNSPGELVEKSNQFDVVFIAITNIKICKAVEGELLNKGIKTPIYYYKK